METVRDEVKVELGNFHLSFHLKQSKNKTENIKLLFLFFQSRHDVTQNSDLKTHRKYFPEWQAIVHLQKNKGWEI